MSINRSLFWLYIVLSLMLIACGSSRPFTKKDAKRAQKLIGLNMSGQSLDVAHDYLLRNLRGYDTMRTYDIDVGIFPSVLFDPFPSNWAPKNKLSSCRYLPEPAFVSSPPDTAIAFASLAQLGKMLRSGEVTSVQLTQMYINRIGQYDPVLKCVITLLEERALAQARLMDDELSKGHDRGPLHGIPYGVKDLLALPGYPTTWGSEPYKDQQLNVTATVIERLDSAGAVLLAKLTSGALARGDVWFGGQTRNPWDTLQGASGSSAGSGAATAAGLVGFSIGTETLGSITSPSNRNGVTGLRPTYGRVSRHGVMSLAWSMDKVGPICRYAEDCALVFEALLGPDARDPTLLEFPFCYDPDQGIGELKVAFFKSEFDRDTTGAKGLMSQALEKIRNLPVEMIPDSMPTGSPFAAFDIILRAESGAFFDELVRTGKVDEMVQQNERSRANSLRQSRFIPAVEYLQAMRHRRLLVEQVDDLFSKYDVIITPTFGRQLLITNLTGHPVVTVPCGLDEKGRPVSISLLGNLFDESTILRLAKVFQDHSDHAGKIPQGFR